MAAAADVRLIVLDVTGREVATLINGWQSPGRHDVVFDRRSGRITVPPGVYFARLQVEREERVRRFVLAP